MATQSSQILDFINRFPGRDDDEIATALGISPRQSVNITCRRLAEEGSITREVGERGKLVNRPAANHAYAESKSPGFSAAEIDIEGAVSLKPHRASLTTGTLLTAGFELAANWVLSSEGKLQTDQKLSSKRGYTHSP